MAYRYNIQCPSENYMLHYTMVRFNVEPPDASGQCLDFLRMLIIVFCKSHNLSYNIIMACCLLTIGYHFTATGAQITQDACGSKEKLSKEIMSGYHGSALTLDFRSNRIHSKGSFYLGVTCTLPSKLVTQTKPTLHQKKQASASSFSYSYSQNGVTRSFSISCSSSQSSRSSKSGTDKPATVKEYFVRHYSSH